MKKFKEFLSESKSGLNSGFGRKLYTVLDDFTKQFPDMHKDLQIETAMTFVKQIETAARSIFQNYAENSMKVGVVQDFCKECEKLADQISKASDAIEQKYDKYNTKKIAFEVYPNGLTPKEIKAILDARDIEFEKAGKKYDCESTVEKYLDLIDTVSQIETRIIEE